MSVQSREVVQDEAEIRLDRWFRRHFPHITQSALQKLLRTGQIRVDGHRADAARRLAPGETVRIPPLPEGPAPKPQVALEPGEARDLERMILYRDEQVIALDKPSGLAVQGGPGIVRHLDGMLDALRFGLPDRPRLVHRIDRDTSGVLLLARTPGVAAALAAAFRGRTVRKTYWALVRGRPDPLEGRIDAALVRMPGLRGERTALARPGDSDTARAVTDFRTLDYAGKKLAWLELSPVTGRTHQLRVHCLAAGVPILGDRKYGGDEALLDGFAAKLHLHARALALPHPAGGTLELAAALPAHMAESFRRIGFSAPPTLPSRRS